MLWLALHLPLLSLEAFCAAAVHAVSAAPAADLSGEPSSGPSAVPAAASASAPAAAPPVALIAEHRITSRNAAAAARGVRVGMKRATALALAGDLLLGEADAARDAAALQAVAHVALAFTPAVTLQDGQATVLMEVQASLRLFGGLAALHRQLTEALAPLAHHVRIAAAPTALGAAILARLARHAARGDGSASSSESNDASRADRSPRGPRVNTVTFDPVLGPHATSLAELARQLDQAPVWLLGPGREHWEALQGMGLKVLADLHALPRSGLARRFGEGLLDDLDRAYGRASDPRRWLELPARFECKLELHQRADSTEQVLTAASVLLARLVAWAQARHGRIVAFTLAMQHEPRHQHRDVPRDNDGGNGSSASSASSGSGDSSTSRRASPATELRIELAAPALDPAHLQLLLRERLARVKLAAPTLELRLRCRELAAGASPNAELFPTRGSEALGLARLLERLRARLGDAQVQCLEPVADHRPERASRGVDAAAAQGSRASLSAKGAASPSMALRSKPTSARAVAEPPAVLPLHRPVWLLPDSLPLAERNALPLLDGQPLQLLAGPERIEAGWWDGATAARDYFIALAADGSLVWVWRRRLPAAAPADAEGHESREVQWMLQGRFA